MGVATLFRENEGPRCHGLTFCAVLRGVTVPRDSDRKMRARQRTNSARSARRSEGAAPTNRQFRTYARHVANEHATETQLMTRRRFVTTDCPSRFSANYGGDCNYQAWYEFSA